jgi:glucose-6-phosphate 1-dehydrogenase (EC 1.1.1.49)
MCRSASAKPSAWKTAAAYYDRAGATRDMLQNHLLQLLCLVAMEPPAQFEAEAVATRK